MPILDPAVDPSRWNLADLMDQLAHFRPEAQAQVFVGRDEAGLRRRAFSWSELEARASSVAAFLVSRGVARQAKVAQYLYNCPEYMESVYASFKASLVPVNTNYRYVERELLYLWDNADVAAVVFHGTFTERIAGLRDKLPGIETWLWVDDGTGSCPNWAVSYEAVASAGRALSTQEVERDGDDLWLLYTGGTTGMPKGVMWRQGDIWLLLNGRRVEPFDLSGGLEGLIDQYDEKSTYPIQLPACPLMHGTGFITALATLLAGGSVVTLEDRRFDPELTLDVIEAEKVAAVAIVGDAFARPMVRALDENKGRWDLSSLLVMASSGVMWSEEVKRGLLAHHGDMLLNDGLGSSEAIGMGKSESTGQNAETTARFTLGEDTCVLTEKGQRVEPGSGERGRIAVSGCIPVGYYKDPEKTAATFPTIDGVRYSIAGDWATIEADGSIRLLGRGSVCINTGGEKVFPEEVEEVLKKHRAVTDALCVGVPDERFGQAITGIVELRESRAASEDELIGLVKQHLAAYKAPKRVLFRPVERAANGKADYNGLREWATKELGLTRTER